MSIERAREMRLHSTEPERRMWRILKQLRDRGYHFRRQVALGPYYADFACHHARLVIEIDGWTHSTDEERLHDARRDAYLRERGFSVLRFVNGDVMQHASAVYDAVAEALARVPPLTPTPDPSPQGGGGGRSRRLREGLGDLAARTGDAAKVRRRQ